MAIASKQLLAFVFATAFFLVIVPNNVHSQPDHIDFQFDKFDPKPKDLIYERDAFVPPDSTFLRLTKTDASGYPQQSSVGRVLYSHPIKFSDPGRQATFETTIKFKITKVNNDPADGLTFFIVPVNSINTTGGEGLNLGIYNALSPPGSPFFAVEFDTYVNTGEPRFRHVGVNLHSVKSETAIPFDDALLGTTVNARINYVSNTRNITVTVEGLKGPLIYEFNLKKHLPQLVQVGISASTGGQVQLNDLHSWYFSSTLVWDSDNGEENYIKQYVM